MKPCFYFFNGSFSYLGQSTDTGFHSHHALQLTFATDKPFIIETESDKKEHMACIVNSDVIHRFDSKDGWHIIILIDPDHSQAISLKENFPFEIMELNYEDLNPHIKNIVNLMIHSGDCRKVKESIESFLEIISGSKGKPSQKDDRVIRIENFIESLEEKKVSIRNLMQLVNLSESRLSHLFKEQTGIPVRKYILWRRLIGGFGKIVEGFSVTDAAHYAGFSDSAHFSRTFKKMFGVAPFYYVKKFRDSSFVQLLNC